MNDKETIKLIENLEKKFKEIPALNTDGNMEFLNRIKEFFEQEEEREKEFQETMKELDMIINDERMIYLSNLKD